jgi:hypothetical protein
MKRPLYVMLWILEALAIFALAAIVILPPQNYSMKEYLEWQAHPSPQT